MKKNIYVKPQIDIVCIAMEQALNAASLGIYSDKEATEQFNDGTVGYGKSNGGGLWDFDDEE